MTARRGARRVARWGVALGLAASAPTGCSGHRGAPAAPAWTPPPPLLDPLPPPADTLALPYLEDVYAQLRPAWRQFIEDCRLRLPPDDALNDPTLTAVVELRVTPAGELRHSAVVQASASPPFDAAALEVVRDAAPLAAAPAAAVSDDELVHLRWRFSRDRRGAGIATAALEVERWPAARAVPALLARDQAVAALGRVAALPPAQAADRPALLDAIAAAELGRRALTLRSADAVVAIQQLTTLLRQRPTTAVTPAMLAPLAAAKTSAEVLAVAELQVQGGDAAALAPARQLLDDSDPAVAAAAARVLAPAGDAAAHAALQGVVAGWIATGTPADTRRALAVLAVVPLPAHVAWVRRQVSAAGTPADRAAACVALAASGLDAASRTALRTATAAPSPVVRAAAVDALAADASAATTRVLLRRLRDRDDSVRARAVSALATRPAARAALRGLGDAAIEIAAARAAAWPQLGLAPAVLAAYRHHADATVRAAFVRAAVIAGRVDADLVAAAMGDAAPEVRAAVVPALGTADLARLRDDAVTAVRHAAYAALIAHDEGAGVDALLPRLATASTEERLRLLGVWAARPAPP